MNKLFGAFAGIAGIAYFIYGIICLAATLAGLQIWFGINAFFAFIIAIFLAYIPIVGTVAGFIGAVDGWGWSNLQAGALFFGPMIFYVILAIFGNFLSKD